MKNFDEVMTIMEAPDYPATCSKCGAEGTNATFDLQGHTCTTTKSRTFKAIIDEWTQTMLDLNRVEGLTEIGLITHLGLLGQKLIYEANMVGMKQAADMVKEMNK